MRRCAMAMVGIGATLSCAVAHVISPPLVIDLTPPAVSLGRPFDGVGGLSGGA